MSADLALTDGKVLTLNSTQPHAEAVAIKGDRIVHVGTNEEIQQWVGKNTQIISLKGKTVVPGFIDTHIHVADFGRLLRWIDLSETGSIKEMQESLRGHVAKVPKGKWLLGRGWNQTRFAEKRLPTRFDLDSVSPDNPVIFYHQNGQVCVVNSKALEMAGVTPLTDVPQGGEIDRDEKTGELTGVLRDNATNLIWAVIPEPSEEELVEATGLACEKIVEAGVTSVHWMVLSSIELSVIRRLLTQNRLPMRIYVIIPMNLLDSIADFKSPDSLVLRMGGAVISADGYLAAKTAALLQPYNDGSATSGKLLYTQEEMNAAAAEILKADLQLVIHAMGDKAVDAALTAIEEISSKVPRKDTRYRIEQAAVLKEELISRIKKHKVIISVQPCVVASEFLVWSATENLGAERARWLYPLKTLLKEGIRVVGGSDCPMEPLSPLMGIQAAVRREIFPEERVTVDEALRMYTVDAAYSSGEENIKGLVEVGKLADLTVLSHDPSEVPPNEIENITVEMTIIGGKLVYSKN
jgi:predicted amidohydrolase YtcJ